MAQESLTFAVVLGAGALLLRPSDFPFFARIAGRLVGVAVRSMRSAKQVTENAIKESAHLAHRQNPDMVELRHNLKQSLHTFESLTTTVRRDIAEVPLNPATLLRKGWRSLEDVANGTRSATTNPRAPTKVSREIRMNANIVRGTTEAGAGDQGPKAESSGPALNLWSVSSRREDRLFMTGVDVITRATEEAALARQSQRVFGTTERRSNETGRTGLSENGSSDLKR